MERFNTGIYQIVNKVNGKRYIGSAVNLRNRKKEHFYKLKRNHHHNVHLQNSYNKRGKNNFVFEIIMHCSKEDLIYFEQKNVDKYDLKKELYNKRKKVDSNLGLKHTERSKRNMSKAQKGKKHTEETKEKLRKLNLGKKLSKEHKNKLLNANLGRKCSEETKEKISKANNGKCLTEEHKKKLSESKIGYIHTEETKNKIRKANSGKNNPMYGKPGTNLGKKFSKEHKEKLSISNKGKMRSEETKTKLRKPIKVFMYETDEFIGEFKSIFECVELLNLTQANVSKVLAKKRNHHKGYTFKYINTEAEIK